MAQTSKVASVCTVKRSLGCFPQRPGLLLEALLLSCNWTSPEMLSGHLGITHGLCSPFHFPPHNVVVLSVFPLPVLQLLLVAGPSCDRELPWYLKAVVYLCVCGMCVSLPLTRMTASEPPLLLAPLIPLLRAGNRRAIRLSPD